MRRPILRWTVGVLAILHGSIHLMGAVKGFEWADVPQLTEPIGAGMGAAWLLASVLLVVAGALTIARAGAWWWVLAIATVASQAVILTSWGDAKAGALANVLLAAAAVYGYRSEGPTSFRARFRDLSQQTETAAVAASGSVSPSITESDLVHLPDPVAGYVRAVGAVGRPHIVGFRADISGRIRRGPDDPWMRWSGAQVDTFGDESSRVFYMDATMKGVPADILHAYIGPHATMRVRVASFVTVVDARGPEMDRAETVTLLNDLCVLAPAALVDAPITWTRIDEHQAEATYTNAGHTVSAVLTFNDQHELVDFVSDDRLASSADGRTFTPRRWSTPIGDYRSFDGRRVGAFGRACWHPDDGSAFAYLEFHADDITYIEVGG